MTITICRKSIAIGLFLGVLFTSSAWEGYVLIGRADLTQAIAAQAKCDPSGYVIVTFPDSSQFSCTQKQYMPPTSYEEAKSRKRGTP